ncbi:hypothetical protein ACFL59_14775 [Planctomycetota bacterium]
MSDSSSLPSRETVWLIELEALRKLNLMMTRDRLSPQTTKGRSE